MQPTNSADAYDLSTTLPGTLFADRFEIRRCVGTGGTSSVFAAFDRTVVRDVALKVLHPWLLQEHSQKRFLQEAKALSRLSHPNIVQTYFCGQWGHFFYIVMELSTGQSLSEKLKSVGKLTVDEAIEIARQAASALGAAHQQGVIHRDVKPGNIMVTTDGGIKVQLLDFGVAKFIDVDTGAQALTATDHIVGTPIYMSPEQCLKEELTPQSDTYSLGCVMYQMLTGDHPFSGETPFNVMYQHMEGTLPQLPAEIPTWLCQLVYAMLEKKSQNRPDSMDEIVEALSRRSFSMVQGRDRRKTRASKNSLVLVTTVMVLVIAGAATYFLIDASVFAKTPKARFAAASKKYDVDMAAKRSDEAYEDALNAARANYEIACELAQGTGLNMGVQECQAVSEWTNKAVLAALVGKQSDYEKAIKANVELAGMMKLPLMQRAAAIQSAIGTCDMYARAQALAGNYDSALEQRERAVAYLADYRRSSIQGIQDRLEREWRRDLIVQAGEMALVARNFKKAKKYYLELSELEQTFEPGCLTEGAALLQAAFACKKMGEEALSKSLDTQGLSCLDKLRLSPGTDRVKLAGVYLKLGQRCLEEGKLSESQRDAELASQLWNGQGLSSVDAAEPSKLLAQISLKRKDYAGAERHYRRCLHIYKLNSADRDSGIFQASIYSLLASIEERRANFHNAIDWLKLGLAAGEKCNDDGRNTPNVESVRIQLAFAKMYVRDKKGADILAVETIRRLPAQSQSTALGAAYELRAQCGPEIDALKYLKLAGEACHRTERADCNCVNIGLVFSNRMSALERFDDAVAFAFEAERIAKAKPKQDEKEIKAIQELERSLKLKLASHNHS